jgi:ceramide glucosyltransferase
MVTGASKFCLGASIAFRRSFLQEIGGLGSLADYLVEDYELGRRIWFSGKKIAPVPHFIDIVVDYKTFRRWWDHQLYWDQNTRTAEPAGFFASVLTRSVPFAIFFAAVRMADMPGLTILYGAVALRIITAAVIMSWGIGDYQGLRSLPFSP